MNRQTGYFVFKYQPPIIESMAAMDGFPESHGVPKEDCVYYWWFEYLKLNEGYRHYCETRDGDEFQELFENFGDIYNISFDEWFLTHGIYLFTEPANVKFPRMLTSATDGQEYSDNELLYLEIPLRNQTSDINKFVEVVVHAAKRELGIGKEGEPGVEIAEIAESEAICKVIGRPDPKSLRKGHLAFKLKEQGRFGVYDTESATAHLRLYKPIS